MNQEDRAFLERRHHRAPETISNVFPGAGPEFSGVAPRRRYDRPCTKILFFGTWIERKGIRQVIEAFSGLARRHSHLQLGVLGAGIPTAHVLAGFPEELHSRITVHSPLSHAGCAELLLDYDIFLLPSFFEGNPLVLVEAMCTGIPVIAASNSGMRDVVRDGQNGLLVTSGNTGEIVSAVERLMADASLRQRLGRQGFVDATARYTWRALAEIVNDVYCRLLKA
jgi:glycosyltransferase involved in cell wall biosynthesis